MNMVDEYLDEWELPTLCSHALCYQAFWSRSGSALTGQMTQTIPWEVAWKCPCPWFRQRWSWASFILNMIRHSVSWSLLVIIVSSGGWRWWAYFICGGVRCHLLGPRAVHFKLFCWGWTPMIGLWWSISISLQVMIRWLPLVEVFSPICWSSCRFI